MIKSAHAQFHCNFPLFHCLESFDRHFFSDAFQALLSAKFNFVLKSWSLSSCVICGPTKIPFIILASLILGNICLKYANSLLHLSIAFTDIFIKLT
jgi:hypothetical protein